jgi:NDP-sugar pyrophosphorylase family protein
MESLYRFFPGLAELGDVMTSDNLAGEIIPLWGNLDSPWSILGGGKVGISSQIVDIEQLIDERNKSLGDTHEIINESESSDIVRTRFSEGRIDYSGGPIIIHRSAKIGSFVRIEGPCYIGADSEIRHSSYLRKGSWICRGAVVGHSTEVKNSILLPNAKAPHFNYVGDSILGIDCNLGAGTKLSNVRNDRREIIVTIEDGSRVYTGLRKLGALVGDRSQLGCNVVTNPGAILTPFSMIPPNGTVNGFV